MPIPDQPAETSSVGETIGVEEEFHVLDPGSGRLTAVDAHALAGLGGEPVAEPELQRTVVETATAVCRTLDELRVDLARRRSTLRAAVAELGLDVVASGTVPDAGARVVAVYPADRYRYLAEEYQQVAREQIVCACQVQVGVPDRELAIAVADRVRVWLPALLAMSVSSPFFGNRDTGYGSYRTMLLSRWPTAGPPARFGSAAEYDRVVDALIRTGTISDPGMVYFDIRPSARYPTVEIRVADACPLLDDVLLLAALGRALVRTAAAEAAAGAPVPDVRPELLRAATWRAARSGLDATLIDPTRAAALPAAELIDRLVGYVRPALAAAGEQDAVADLLAAARRRGTAAARQRAALARHGDLRDVVRLLIEETGADLG
ncbi:MAG TPA: glutamate--cysteine ligase [Mycobacteriales bacterium]|nr:glutamate--cysteine ligase [Mycobacteriales bacterium]